MTSKDEEFWSNRFHACALAAGFLAASEGRLHDSLYVKQLAYEFYESGAFTEPANAGNDVSASNTEQP